jgi:protein-S-isoprenylcysteine O-methyltransferase Ste14
MSLVPAFELGFWNAWIFMACLFLIMYAVAKLKKGEAPKNELEALSKTEKRIFNSAMLVFFSALIYSVFLPLKLGTIWFNVGLPITLIGLVSVTIAMANFATTPWDEPVTKGLYHYSRHPIYITLFIFLLGVSIASASWLFLLLSTVFTILNSQRAIHEERFCLEKYGDAYREYLNRTPKWIGIPKSGEG